MNDMELVLNYPSELAKSLQDGSIDVALLPVAAMHGIPGAHIISDYGIASDGVVASVAIFSQVPMEQIQTVYLDYQSRTSVRLAQLLLKLHWKQDVLFKPAPKNYIEHITGTTAGVIIGDRALMQLPNFQYIYDLATGWKSFTGLDFIFAAWVANKELPKEFMAAFNEANAEGLQHIEEVAAANAIPYYSLQKYYTENIKFYLDEEKRKGLTKFLELIKTLGL
jgi:chorismate dehydratase